MATEFTREWITFFTECGIPNDVATMYALIFYENRIQKNMLLDLNKEYLRDMGITVMGDVIAILRYAKIVHKKYVSEQILSDIDDLPVGTQEESSPPSAAKQSASVKRILKHYTRKYSTSDISPKEVKVILPNENRNPALKVTAKNSQIQGNALASKKLEISYKTDLTAQALEVPSQRGKNALLDSEKKFRIKSQEKSKQVLEQARKKELKTVFDRLGESSVTSTTSDSSLGNSSSNSLTSTKEKVTSVFSRLGEKASAVSSSSGENSESDYQKELPYVGILKSGSPHKKSLTAATMRADNEKQVSPSAKPDSKKATSVKTRLGLSTENLKRTKTELSTSGKMSGGQTPSLTSSLEGKEQASRVNLSQNKVVPLKASSRLGKAVISTTNKNPVSNNMKAVKRKLETPSNNGVNLSKKVRFGATTLRLIPTKNSLTPKNNTDQYPKLTMIISNRGENPAGLSDGNGNAGMLKSDRIHQKTSLAGRIGSKSIKGRLGKRPADQMSAASSVPNKVRSIRDRLG